MNVEQRANELAKSILAAVKTKDDWCVIAALGDQLRNAAWNQSVNGMLTPRDRLAAVIRKGLSK